MRVKSFAFEDRLLTSSLFPFSTGSARRAASPSASVSWRIHLLPNSGTFCLISRQFPELKLSFALPFAAVCHSQRGLTYSPEPGFASAQASAHRHRSSSAGVCGTAVSCSADVGSRSTRSSYVKVVSVTKSARSNA